MEFTTTGHDRITHVKSCVVYDPNGVIRHVHHVVDMEGVEETPQSIVADRALALARRTPGVDPAGLKTLHADPSVFRGRVRMRVDTQNRILLPEEITSR